MTLPDHQGSPATSGYAFGTDLSENTKCSTQENQANLGQADFSKIGTLMSASISVLQHETLKARDARYSKLQLKVVREASIQHP